MKIIPVTAPNINWEEFVTEANAALGRSPTDSLDAAGIPPGTLRTYIAALGELEQPGTMPVPYLRSRRCDRALEHLSFSFLAIDVDVCALLTLSKLSVIVARPGVTLMSGTLKQWREILIDACRAQSELHTRQLLNEISRHFLRFGLNDIFADHVMRDLTDGTFALESKK